MRRPALAVALVTIVVSWAAPGVAVSGQESSSVSYRPPVDAPVVDTFRPPPPDRPWEPGNRGIDYGTEPGTPAGASAGGEVVFAGQVGGHLHVVVLHPDGIRTSYSFLRSVAVKRGDHVAQGDVVGTTGNRLHFGARQGDTYIDPMELFKRGSPRVHLVPHEQRRPASESQERSALMQTSRHRNGHPPPAGAGTIDWARRRAKARQSQRATATTSPERARPSPGNAGAGAGFGARRGGAGGAQSAGANRAQQGGAGAGAGAGAEGQARAFNARGGRHRPATEAGAPARRARARAVPRAAKPTTAAGARAARAGALAGERAARAGALAGERAARAGALAGERAARAGATRGARAARVAGAKGARAARSTAAAVAGAAQSGALAGARSALSRFFNRVGDMRGAVHYVSAFNPLTFPATMGAAAVEWWRERRFCTPAHVEPPKMQGRRAALLVAGLGSTSEDAAVYGVRTTDLGYAPSDVVRFSYAGGSADENPFRATDTTADIRQSGRRLRELLQRMALEKPGVPIDIIAHSQGGLVARTALTEEFDGLDSRLPRITSFVTLGSPHQGADGATALALARHTKAGDLAMRAAHAALPGTVNLRARSVRQMAETSKFIERLNRRPLPSGVWTTSIGAREDVIVAAGRTRLPGAHHVVVSVPGVNDHADLPRSKQAHRELALALARKNPTCQRFSDAMADAVVPRAISWAEDGLGVAMWAGGKWVDGGRG